MDNKFNFNIRLTADVVIIDCEGYINKEASEKIAESCYNFMDDGKRKFLLNLEKSTVINSIGVSIIIEIIEKLQDVDGQIGYFNLAPIVAKTFKIMGLTDYSTIYQNEEEALKELVA